MYGKDSAGVATFIDGLNILLIGFEASVEASSKALNNDANFYYYSDIKNNLRKVREAVNATGRKYTKSGLDVRKAKQNSHDYAEYEQTKDELANKKTR